MADVSNGRILGDLGDMFTSIYLVIFAIIVLPLTLYVSFRGILVPRLSALLSIVSICFVFSYSIQFINDIAYYIGLAAIPVLSIVAWRVEGSSPILVASALPLHLVYTLYSMFLVQTITEPNGFIQFAVPSSTSWITCLFVALLLAVASGFFMHFADDEPRRHLFIVSTATTGIFFGIHYVGAIFSGRLVVNASDYFKIFALQPWICWPTAVSLIALAAWIQFEIKEPASSPEENTPLVLEAVLNPMTPRHLEDLGNSLVLLFVMIISIVAIPLSIFVACRGVVFPRMSAFMAVVTAGFVGSFIANGPAFVIGMGYIVVGTLVTCFSPVASTFLISFNATLVFGYTIFTLGLSPMVNTPGGYVPASTVENLPLSYFFPAVWVQILVGVSILAISAIAGAAAYKIGKPMIIVSSSLVGVLFSVYLVGSYLSKGLVESSFDYFKIFVLRPIIAWPAAIVLTALTSWIQFITTKEVPAVTVTVV